MGIRFCMKKRMLAYDDYNGRFPKETDCWGTVTAETPRTALRHGWKLVIEYEDNNI